MDKIYYCKICGALDYAHKSCSKCGSSAIVAANLDFLYTTKQKQQNRALGYDTGLRSMFAGNVFLGQDIAQQCRTASDNILISGIEVASIPRVSHIFARASKG